MSDAPDTTDGFGRGMLLLVVANAAYVVTAYVVTTVTARVLGPGDFGDFGVVMAWVTVLTALLVKGVSTVTNREMAAGRVDEATAWRAGRGLGLRLAVGLALIGAAGSSLVANAIGVPGLADQFAIGALGALTFGINAVLLAWPTGRRDYPRQAIAQVAYALARVLLVVGGAMSFGLVGAVIGYVLAPLLSATTIIARVPASSEPLEAVLARMRRAVVPLSLASIAISAWFVVDVFAVSATMGESSVELGAYVAFGTIAHVPFFLLQATSVAIVPALAGLAAGAAQRAAIRRTLTDTLVLLAGPTLLLVTAGDAAARVVFGTAFAVDGLVAAPLALATAAVTILSVLVAVSVAVGRLGPALIVNGVGIFALAIACLAVGGMSGAGASEVAWAVAPVSWAAAVALGLHVLIRHRALLTWTRAATGVAVAAIAAAPPLLVEDDVVRMLLAAACGVAWLAAVVRLRLVDLRRSTTPVGDALVDAQGAG
jgi:O-antigen/teichoic acid export membrane protein